MFKQKKQNHGYFGRDESFFKVNIQICSLGKNPRRIFFFLRHSEVSFEWPQQGISHLEMQSLTVGARGIY